MNMMLEKCREKFIEDNDYYEKVYLPEEEQERLNQKIIERDYNEGEENPFNKYSYEETEDNLYKFYEKKPMHIPDSELNQYISLKMLELTKAMDEKQKTMKNIMIFWLILTIISLISSLYLISKVVNL